MATRQSTERICPICDKPFPALLTEIKRGAGIFCSQVCYHKSRARPLEERFWEKVQKTESCWLWTGARNQKGHPYGTISHGTPKRKLFAHRVSWGLHFGPIPEGMEICHDCPGGDRPDCVRPSHLFLSNHAGNMADMAAKGLAAGAYGENHPNAKLTWAAVRAMRALHARGGVTIGEVAAEFRVPFSTAQNAIRGITWKE